MGALPVNEVMVAVGVGLGAVDEVDELLHPAETTQQSTND
jgi:hypothetical protein